MNTDGLQIRCQGVSKVFGDQPVLKDVSFEVRVPHVLALIGPSGGGKSTLLRVLGGLISPTTGTVAVNGQVLSKEESGLAPYRKRIGTVFQAYNLFPHLTALENVMLPLKEVHHFPDAEDRANATLSRFRLSDHMGKRPAELSGGQRQRVAIARALAIDPAFLLMDEPTSALDPEMTAEVLEVISSLRSEGRPLVLVTHAMGFARSIADHVLFIGEGRIIESAPSTEFFSAPKAPEAAQFLEKILRY
ncbi:glutamine ABC transporter ATP-binding protein [Spartobacteria bacterium LR76]|nr:glutamine ABC transporter ATP-binding protein [Spartobacteria bacterium LR76]